MTSLIGEDRTFGGNELFIDLIPKSCWFTNVRTCITPSSWNKLRNMVYERANYKCECCNYDTQTGEIKLEAHERWCYDMETKTQKLMRIVALCENCHLATHFGRARIIGREHDAIEHLMEVKNIGITKLDEHIKEAQEIWKERNKYNWKLDLELLKKNNIELIKKYNEFDRKEISKKTIEKYFTKQEIPIKEHTPAPIN